MTDQGVQNILRGRTSSITDYLADFQSALDRAVQQCKQDFGDLRMTIAIGDEVTGQSIELQWKDVALLMTAIGSQTLTIRGSDKSMFGKLFERLIFGSVLTVLGFERVEQST